MKGLEKKARYLINNEIDFLQDLEGELRRRCSSLVMAFSKDGEWPDDDDPNTLPVSAQETGSTLIKLADHIEEIRNEL
jgi:hypothetical protein